MTNNDAMKYLDNYEVNSECEIKFDSAEELNSFISICKKSIKKQIDEKPTLIGFKAFPSYYCNCGESFGYPIKTYKSNYCPNCGQKLNWEDIIANK